jgi:uncharacterized membrane protein
MTHEAQMDGDTDQFSVEAWLAAAFMAERAPQRVLVARDAVQPRRFVPAVRPFYTWMLALTLLAWLLR